MAERASPIQAARQRVQPLASPRTSLQRVCAFSNFASGEGEYEETCKRQQLQRQAGGGQTADIAPPIVQDVLRSPGHPLDAATRKFMEPRFGHDFSRVRVHTDAHQLLLSTELATGYHRRAKSTDAPPVVQDALRSPGEALDSATRALMAARFGTDFSEVRVHTDPVAAQSARTLNAHSYTVGNDLVFAPGRYAPQTNDGQRLLAHELTHYVQQAGSAANTIPGSAPAGTAASLAPGGRSAEIEADRNAERIAVGAQAQVNVAAPVGVAMKGEGDDPAAERSYWFQSKPPERPVRTESGIEITPKGQVFLDPSVRSILVSSCECTTSFNQPRPGIC